MIFLKNGKGDFFFFFFCISIVKFFILVNGTSRGFFESFKGIR